MGLCIVPLVWIWLVLLGVAVVGAADCAPASSSFTIKTAQDVIDIATCATFTGNLVVAADGPSEVSLDGIATILGNLDVENVANLRSLSSTSLQTVQSFTLNNLPKLSEITFPALRNFSSLKWYNLPAVQNTTVATGASESEIQEITIFDTSIKSLDWIAWPVGSRLNISNNANLETFTIPYNKINTGSALTLSNNAALHTIGLSQLTGIYGGLNISSNAKTTELTFDKLETIGGFVQLSGDYNNISMPALSNINGALSVQSSDDITNLCNTLQQKQLQGHYDCTSGTGKTPTSETNPQAPTATVEGVVTPDSDSSTLSQGVKIGVALAVIVLVIATLVGGFFYFRHRIRSKVQEISHRPKDDDAEARKSVQISEANTSSTSFAKELESPQIRVEMATGRERAELEAATAYELDSKHGASELVTPITPVSPSGSWGGESARSDAPFIRHELPG